MFICWVQFDNQHIQLLLEDFQTTNDAVVVIIWKFDLQLPIQSVPITTNVLSLNLLWRGVLDTTLYNYCLHLR